MTNTTSQDRSTAPVDSLFRTLASERRRTIVRLLAGPSPDGIEKADLAARLAAVTNEKPLDAVTDDERRQSSVALTHSDLPALTDAGLLAEREDGSVAATDHWAFDEYGFDDALAGRPPDELDGVFAALAESRRRTILSVLRDQPKALSTRTLARNVAAREAELPERSVPSERVDRVLTSLVHVDLPLLADAGLVSYDDAEGRVAYEGHPVLRTAWVDTDRDPGANGDEIGFDITARLAGIAPSSD
ncbi:DUF7344 domain-containing protein [Halosolutus halophilus]|uniref:DUF7344 domain-containing protein n=1 Tax=Halosolutus halophilus TaxID=1552990 RepID=UPI0022352FE8|nr:hypothetical protein [Halosolutus halophilus]